ncbi:hypothetical protein N9578_00335 [bacterium]|jgi:hypothetical protein|nr:hypothetical protein [bacterium]MDB4128487.1 hypothetical protein [bacterium]
MERNLNTYSKYMTVTFKQANFMHYQVKGHLIPDSWDNDTIISMYDSYFKRLWNNNERAEICEDDFLIAWEQKWSK